jgi:hypothetical protein
MGQALRMGIESQIAELGEFCVSVLDFTQVVVLDYSCADEAVAKLVLRFQRDDRPSNAWFVARGLSEQHREAIEEVLIRHNLSLAAEVQDEGFTLLGSASDSERDAWDFVEQYGAAEPAEIARALGCAEADVCSMMDALAGRRAVFKALSPVRYVALSSLVAQARSTPGQSRD